MPSTVYSTDACFLADRKLTTSGKIFSACFVDYRVVSFELLASFLNNWCIKLYHMVVSRWTMFICNIHYRYSDSAPTSSSAAASASACSSRGCESDKSRSFTEGLRWWSSKFDGCNPKGWWYKGSEIKICQKTSKSWYCLMWIGIAVLYEEDGGSQAKTHILFSSTYKRIVYIYKKYK